MAKGSYLKGRYAKEDWVRLGRAFVERRVQLGIEYLRLQKFSDDKDFEYRVLWDLEAGTRDNYEPATLIRAEIAYELKFGAIRNCLEGGELTPAGFTSAEQRVMEQAAEAFRLLAGPSEREARGKPA